MEEAKKIGKEIFSNECSSKKERLVWWNVGEDFPSLGIGHFIWYSKNSKRPFEETFPDLLSFLEHNHICLPDWLSHERSCPWSTKKEFLEDKIKRKQLQDFLSQTVDLQAQFIAQRTESMLLRLFSYIEEEKKEKVQKHIAHLEASWQGKFALIDYLHFKGDGTMESERYAGKGWGLKQVLEEMSDDEDAVSAFVEAAKAVLEQRVKSKPTEKLWLHGWHARIDRYLKS